MRLVFIPLCMGLVCFAGTSTDLLAESQKKVYVGVDVGVCRILDRVDGYRVGGEIGFHISKRVGIIADLGYAYETSHYYARYIYTSVPISGSLVFIFPVTQNFFARLGIGYGYYPIKVKEELTGGGGEYYWERIGKYNGFAPHIRISFEAKVSSKIAIYAEIKQIYGEAELESGSDPILSLDRFWIVDFSGPEVKAGVKFYLW